MQRDSGVEVLRCIFMFGICLLHSIAQAGHNTIWAANMLFWCVPAFMFISGWFGIKFSVGKVLKLYGISFYCAAVFVAFDTFFLRPCEWGFMRVYSIAIGQWFLNAYAIVMCLAPMVNLAIERMTIKELCPLAFLVFGWSFATTLPIHAYVPFPQGLTAYSFLTLLGVYVVARLARKSYDAGGRFCKLVRNKKLVLPVIGLCLIMAAIGLGDYNSPFAITIAGGAFFMIRSYGFPSWLGRVCVWLGPSIFSVYLMHSHGQGWGYLAKIQDALLGMGMPIGIAYVGTAACVFFVCVFFDMPRRIVARMVSHG